MSRTQKDQPTTGAGERDPAVATTVQPSEAGPPPLRLSTGADDEIGLKRQGNEHTRGGSSYQHSLSARGIKSSGRARSHSSEDLLTTMERLEQVPRLPVSADVERAGGRAFGHPASSGTSSLGNPKDRLDRHPRAPHFDW